jgi:hypothetical protein
MANQYDTNLKLQAIADAIGDTSSSGLISALEDIADAVAGGGGGSSTGLVSDNFSETDTYDLGDYCIHNNTLYVCINAITTPGPWDLSDWQATNTGLELSSLNSAIATKANTPTTYSTGTVSIAASTYTTVDIPFTDIPSTSKCLTPYFASYPDSTLLSVTFRIIKTGNAWRISIYNTATRAVSVGVLVDYIPA